MIGSPTLRTRIIELRTLGTLDLHIDDGRELASVLTQSKWVALLCYLALTFTNLGASGGEARSRRSSGPNPMRSALVAG